MVGGIKNGKTKPINRDCICFFILYNLLRLDSLDHQPLYKLIYIFIVSCLYFYFFSRVGYFGLHLSKICAILVPIWQIMD